MEIPEYLELFLQGADQKGSPEKTLNILQQINAKSFGVRQGLDVKNRRNMVAFLRKVA